MKREKRAAKAATKNARPAEVTGEGAGAAAISEEAKMLKLRPVRRERNKAAYDRKRDKRDWKVAA